MTSYKKLIGAGLAGLAVILFFIMALPAWQSISNFQAEIKTRQGTLDQKTALVQKIADWKKETLDNEGNLDKLATILPQDKKTQDIIVGLEDIAKTAGIQMKSLRTGAVSQTGGSNAGYQLFQVEVSGSGQYKAIVDFIKSLEKNLRIFDVQQITISTDTSASSSGGLNLQAKFYAYYVE